MNGDVSFSVCVAVDVAVAVADSVGIIRLFSSNSEVHPEIFFLFNDERLPIIDNNSFIAKHKERVHRGSR